MNRNSLVTVIVPIFNAEKYLNRCLYSIVNQTYHNLEIILINDGSTDGSEKICRQYMRSDPRIQLFSQENQGQSVARNVGLDHMSGEYLTFIDADDYVDLSYIEILLGQLTKYQVPAAVCDYDEVDEGQTGPIAAHSCGACPCQKVSRNQVYASQSVLFVMIGGKLYQKEVFRTLRFPVGRVREDEFVFHQIYRQIESICFIKLPLYHYVQSKDSTMRADGRPKMHKDFVNALLERLKYFQEYGGEKYIETTAFRIIHSAKSYCEYAGMNDRQIRNYMIETIKAIKHITGRWLCPAKTYCYVFAPRLYSSLRCIYRRIFHLPR